MTSAVTSGWVRSADQRRRSADRIDSVVGWEGAGAEVRAWRAECLARRAGASGFSSGGAVSSRVAVRAADGRAPGRVVGYGGVEQVTS